MHKVSIIISYRLYFNIKKLKEASMQHIAIILSTFGYHWEELIDAYEIFKQENWSISFYTINGEPAVADPKSLEKHILLSFIGLGLRNSFSPVSFLGKELQHSLQNSTFSIHTMNIDRIDAIYIVGGYGCLFDVNINHHIHEKLLEAYKKGKFISAVSHGVASLALTKIRSSSLIKNRKITGSLDVIDSLFERFGLIDKQYLPLPSHNEKILRENGAILDKVDYYMSLFNPGYFIVDLPFITGSSAKSAKRVAYKLVILKKIWNAVQISLSASQPHAHNSY
jgi:putative intracellular protease/amidase